MLRMDFSCTFFIRTPSAYLCQEIQKAGAAVVEMPAADSYEAEAEAWASRLEGSELIVLDGYHFQITYQRLLKARGCRLVCIDDIHAYPFAADVIINHSGSARRDQYEAPHSTQFYLGFKYSLLRKAFLCGRSGQSANNTLLICLGGADPDNNTLQVWKQVAKAGFSAIHILVGAAYQFRTELEFLLSEANVPVTIHQSLEAEAVASLMQQCSHAVLSPSTTALEYMSFSGVVYLCQIADNQSDLKSYFLDNGLAKDFSDFRRLSIAEEEEMIRKQKSIFDGRSGSRLLQLFQAINFMADSRIEIATERDLDLTYQWANDLVARQMSHNTDSIPADVHASWFMEKLNDRHCRYYLFHHGSKAFAQIRFDQKNEFYLLSYSIDAAYRGRGLGPFILSEGIRKLRADLGTQALRVVGYVKKENISSILSFEKLKFRREETIENYHSNKYCLES
jgi:spore coat polysaccharide biosynthesis predicted glycosyltransferase SpsG/ribosomal protein S18 acetylase RimI-like enzyme